MSAPDHYGSFLVVNEIIADFMAGPALPPYRGKAKIGAAVGALVSMYRTRGIIQYLMNGDLREFFLDLHREALTFRTLLRFRETGIAVADREVSGSNYSPVACAIAVGDESLVKELDSLMPRARARGEGAELFTLTLMMRYLATGVGDGEGAFRAFDEGCGESMQYQHLVRASRGLLDGSPKVFDAALKAFLDSFAALEPEEADELGPGEDQVSIEGLAFVQLAKRFKLKFSLKHKMIPVELQKPTGTAPTSGFPGWPA